MATATKDSKINPDAKTENDGVKRMPHERDETPDGQDREARGIMKQAADDLAQGLVDTDLHGMRGAERTVPATGPSGQARPQKDAADGMRDQRSTIQSNDEKK